jgi:hypothetical protein
MHLKVRRTDPETSVEAAESVQDKIRASQAAVLLVLNTYYPEGCTDSELIIMYRMQSNRMTLPRQSESGIRTRRSELVERGLVEDTGKRDVLASGRRSIIWKVC